MKIQISFSLILIIFLIADTALSTWSLRSSMEELLMVNQTQILEQTIRSMDEEVKRMDNLALRILYQKELKTIMNRASASREGNHFIREYADSRDVRSILTQVIGPDSIPLRISLFTKEGDYIYFGSQPVNGDLIHRRFEKGTVEELTSQIDLCRGGRLIRFPEEDLWYDRGAGSVFSLYREFRDLDHSYGYIHIQEPLSRLKEILTLDLPGAGFLLHDATGKLLYMSHFRKEKAPPVNQILNLIRESGSPRKSFIHTRDSAYTGWSLSLYQNSDIFLSRIRSLQFCTLLMTAALLLIGSFIIHFLTRILVKPLQELHESIYRVNLHNLKINLEEKDSYQIIKQLNDGFQIMFRRLQDSLEEQLQSRDREAQAHMTALQNQMHPHLLYNMLAHISNLAADEETGKIEEVCQRLSRSLRYLTGAVGNQVGMVEEISHLKDYLSLMKSHYDPLFEFTLEWEDPSLKDFPIPKLIFQPIAENAFHHGFQDVEPPWLMDVRIGRKGPDRWLGSFWDNGCGILPEKQKELLLLKKAPLSEMRDRVINHPPGGVALINTITRLRLLYGEDLIFDLESREGDNTIMIGGPFVQNPAG